MLQSRAFPAPCASTPPWRAALHDTGSVWVVRPSPYDDAFIHNPSPGSPCAKDHAELKFSIEGHTDGDEMRRQSEQEGNAQADLLKSMMERFKEGNFGGASTDLNRHNQGFTDARTEGLVGCLAIEFGDWIRVVKPIVQSSRAVFGGTATIDEYYSTSQASVRAQILLSPTADGMAEVWNPRSLGKEYTDDKTFPDGTVARVGPKKIVARVGHAFLSWETKLGTLSAGELWLVAGHSIDRACVKSRS